MADPDRDTEWLATLRTDILSLLRRSETGADSCRDVLEQILAFLDDDEQVKTLATALGMDLSGFQTDAHLELYYDIERTGDEVGFVSKGWNDAGFLIGDILLVPSESAANLRTHAKQIQNLCAHGHLIHDVTISPDANAHIGLNILIDQNQFTQKTFAEALDTIQQTVTKIRRILGLPEV